MIKIKIFDQFSTSVEHKVEKGLVKYDKDQSIDINYKIFSLNYAR